MQITEINPGIPLVCQPLPHVRSVALGFWIESGVLYETEAQAGASHFLEHLLFKGSANYSAREISEIFDHMGGEINAYTSKEYTCFYCKVVDKHLEKAVTVLTDMLSRPLLAAMEVTKERNVILEEINMYQDTPDDYVHDLLARTLWPEHSLGLPILGTRESVTGQTPTGLRELYSNHYRAGKVVIAAAGSFDGQQLAAWLKAGLDLAPSSHEPIEAAVPVFTAGSELVERATEQLHLALAFPGLSLQDPELYSWNLLTSLLGSGMSSRLFQSLREEHGLVYSVYTYSAVFKPAGYTALYLGLAPANAPAALDLIACELADVKSNIGEQELIRVKEQVKGNLILGLESTSSHMGRMGRNLLLRGEVPDLEGIISRIDAVTIDDVLALARRIFSRETMAVAAVGKIESLHKALSSLTWS